MDWNEDKVPLMAMPSYSVAIPRTNNIDENIRLILQTRPVTKKIYLVIGDSAGERNLVKRIPIILGKYTDRVEFVLMNKLPYAQMLQHIRSAEDNSAVLVLQWFSDVEGKSFVGVQVTQTICQEAKVPVYATQIQHLGSGTVGGYVTNMEIAGQTAANVVLDILSGKKPY